MYRIAICDDNQNYIMYLIKLITALEEEDVSFFKYDTGMKLLMDIDIQHDLIILDVHLGEMDGTELAKQVRKKNKNAVLVFCSGVKQPTSESFKVTAYRYLEKQVPEERIKKELIEILQKMHEVKELPVLIVHGRCGTYKIRVQDIMYISKNKRGSIVHIREECTEKEEFNQMYTDEHLRQLYEYLAKYGFEYAHDSYIINCKWVRCIKEKSCLILDNGVCLTISRSKMKRFEEAMIEYWSNKY